MNDNSRMLQKMIRKMKLPKVKVKDILKNRENMIKELKTKCSEQLTQSKKKREHTAKPINAMNAIKTMLE